MAVLKCKMCGGDLHPVEGCTTVECEYCGSMQTVAIVDNEKKANLFNRANRLRMASEFDKAAGVYESIVSEFPEEAEAYWGLCLCAYGIEYVDDPGTGRKIPTCHRTLPESILDCGNFDMACEYADSVAKKIYREEAKAIDRLQRDTLAIVASEEPYDVFICYKETGEDGSRTEDSVLGQDIYDALTAKGLKVFFARISLEDKLGRQYEPYIYAALHSAKVMLTLGTKFEHYDAVWVKNEWGRYLDMASKDKTKTLIPCYKGIDAYDIPKEFRSLQAQDMGKLGWLQDLVRGVQKLCGKEDAPKPQPVQVVQQAAPAQQGSVTVDSLMRRAALFMEDGDFKSANEYLNKVLDISPEYAPAYLGRVQAANNLRKEAELGSTTNAYESSADWQKALRFATPEQKKQYEAYLNGSQAAREEKRRLDHYNNTIAQMKRAKTPGEYHTVAATFDNMAGYSDSAAKARECRHNASALLNEDYNKALKLLNEADDERKCREAESAFLAIKQHRDSAAKAEEARQKGAALEKARLEKQEREQREREAAEAEARRKYKKTTTIMLVILALFIAAVCAYIFVIQPAMTYSKAQNELAAGNYDVAAEIFTGLGDYKDSADMAQESQYQKGVALMEAGKYDAATETFNGISGYSDSAELAQESQYRKGTKLMEAGDAEAAMTVFLTISDYKDSKIIYQPHYYNLGKSQLDAGQKGEALLSFRRAGDYEDAASIVDELELFAAGRVAAGEWHTVGLKADGTVVAIGNNYYDQRNVSGWTDIIAVAAGDRHTVGLKADGTVVAIGNNYYDQRNVSGWTDIIAVAAGNSHTVGLKADGTVVAVGSNFFGQCNVDRWTDIVAVAAGRNHTVVLRADGTVVAVGYNEYGQCDVSGWTDIVAVAAGSWHTVGLKADGTVVAVGYNKNGQCDVSGWTDIVAVAAGGWHTVGLKADGTVVAVGYNEHGQCDVSGWTDIVAVAAGDNHTVGLKADGSVVAVGDNEDGQCDVSGWDLW